MGVRRKNWEKERTQMVHKESTRSKDNGLGFGAKTRLRGVSRDTPSNAAIMGMKKTKY